MPTKKSRAAYMRAYRAKEGATRGRPRTSPPTKGQKEKIALQRAWKLGCRELADLGTPIHVQLNRSGKITLTAKFTDVAHAFDVLVGHRTGDLSWMYELLCLAVYPEGISRGRWKRLHPAFWMKESALRTERLGNENAD